jgi:hypothetical protein
MTKSELKEMFCQLIDAVPDSEFPRWEEANVVFSESLGVLLDSGEMDFMLDSIKEMLRISPHIPLVLTNCWREDEQN